MSDSTRWPRLRSMLERALDAPANEREARLRQECGDDEALLREALELLELESAAERLEPVEAARLVGAFNEGAVPQVIGPYRVEGVLGAGGMGTVYRARRGAGDFEQVVALKLIKRGMDTDEVLRRFHNERNVLASLRHRNIAQLFDGGASEDGRPWFAMELVEGRSLTRWNADERPSLRRRVEVFLEVCDAVQYAHAALVVHRDLKPENILIDAGGRPKLVDFGIAKVMDHGASSMTIAAARPLTPAYASPEQLRGEAVTTASDVYSLGVVLCELLSGVRPFGDDPLDLELRDRPTRPSALLPGATASDDLEQRRALVRSLRGDLDTIVTTALEPEVARRYASVDALAADLRRWLANLPIQAREPTRWYVVRKFVQRNTLAVSAAIAVFVALTGGAVASYVGFRRAESERIQAELARDAARSAQRESEERRVQAQLENERANAVLDVVKRMLAGASPHSVRQPDYTLRELLEEFDASLRDQSAPLDPRIELPLRTTMCSAYRKIGDFDAARRHLARAEELDHTNDVELIHARVNLLHDLGAWSEALAATDAWLARADLPSSARRSALWSRADVLHHVGRFAESESLLRRLVAQDEFEADADTDSLEAVLSLLATVLSDAGRANEAAVVAERAIELSRAAGRADHSSHLALESSLAHIRVKQGRLDEALALARRSVQSARQLLGPMHPDVASFESVLGGVLHERGEHDAALESLVRASELQRAVLPPGHPDLAISLGKLGSLHEKRGEYVEAEHCYRECLAIRTAAGDARSFDAARAASNLGSLLMTLGRETEAEPLIEAAVSTRRALGDERGLALSLLTLSALVQRRGQSQLSLELAEEAVALLRCAPEANETDLASGLNNLAGSLAAVGDAERAIRFLRESLALRLHTLGPRHRDVAKARSNLGELLNRSKAHADARRELEHALEIQLEVLGPRHTDVARTKARLAAAVAALGEPDQALTLQREALSIFEEKLGPNHATTKTARAALTTLKQRSANGEAP